MTKTEKIKNRGKFFWIYGTTFIPVFLYAGYKAYAITLLLAFPVSIFLFKKFFKKELPLKLIIVQHVEKFVCFIVLGLFAAALLPHPLVKPPILFGNSEHKNFKARIQKLYPEGTSHEKIVRDLKWQMFDVEFSEKAQRFHAEYTRNPIFFCVADWHISWINDGGKIKDVKSHVGGACI